MKVTLRQWRYTSSLDSASANKKAISDDIVALTIKMQQVSSHIYPLGLLRLPDMSFHWDCCGTPELSRVRIDCGKVESAILGVKSCAHCGKDWIEIKSCDSDDFRYFPISASMAEAIHHDNISKDRLVLLKKRMVEISLLIAV